MRSILITVTRIGEIMNSTSIAAQQQSPSMASCSSRSTVQVRRLRNRQVVKPRAVAEQSATKSVLTDDSVRLCVANRKDKHLTGANGLTQPRKFSFVVANADFMLNDENNEHFPELLRERRRHYKETDQPIDFWMVEQPAFVDSLGEVSKKVRRPCVALVSTNDVWIKCVPYLSILIKCATTACDIG
jgi:hypothetical protein